MRPLFFLLVLIAAGAAPALGDNELAPLAAAVQQMCLSPADSGSYWKASGTGSAEGGIILRIFGVAGGDIDLELTDEQWDGAQRVLRKEQAAEMVGGAYAILIDDQPVAVDYIERGHQRIDDRERGQGQPEAGQEEQQNHRGGAAGDNDHAPERAIGVDGNGVLVDPLGEQHPKREYHRNRDELHGVYVDCAERCFGQQFHQRHPVSRVGRRAGGLLEF